MNPINVVHLSGDQTLDYTWVIDDDLHIQVDGDVTLTLTSPVDVMLRHDAELTISGGRLTLDAAGLASKAVFWSSKVAPNLENVTVKNGLRDGFLLTTLLDNVGGGLQTEGNPIYRRCGAVDCGTGFFLYGHNPLRNQSLLVEDCFTSGTTGSLVRPDTNQKQIFFARSFKTVVFRGGQWEGDENAWFTNAYKCDRVDIDGGYYKGIGNGPNVNNQCQQYTIRGVVAEDCSNVGIHADTKNPEPGTVTDYGVVSNNIARNCGTGIRMTGDRYSVIGNAVYDCGTYYRFVEKPLDVWVDGNFAFNSQGTKYIAYWVQPTTVDGACVRFGKNWSNSDAASAITATGSRGLVAQMSSVR